MIRKPSLRGLEAILLLVVLLFCWGLSRPPLSEPDEARYAEIAREMAQGGDLVTPHLNGIRYFEKPVLWFWFAALSIRVLGVNELAVRLPSLLAVLLTAFALFSLARQPFGREKSLLASLLFLTSPLVFLLGRCAMLDMLLCACVTCVYYCAWNARASRLYEDLRFAPAALGRRKLRPFNRWGRLQGSGMHRLKVRSFYAAGFWFACALAFLCKGPIGLLAPLSALFLYILFYREWALAKVLAHPPFLLVFPLVCAPWYLLMEFKNPGYLHTFLIEQNLGRALSGNRFNRDNPLWFYLPIIFIVAFPWTAWLPRSVSQVVAAVRSKQSSATEAQRFVVFLACAVLGPLLLLSVAHSKLFYYVLPLLPPLSLLLANATEREVSPSRRLSPYLAVSLSMGTLGAVFLALGSSSRLFNRLLHAAPKLEKSTPMLRLGLAPLGLAMLLLAISAGVAAYASRPSPRAAAMLLGTGMAVALLVIPFLGVRLAPWYSARPIVRAIEPLLEDGDVLFEFRDFYRGVPFYLKRPVIIWQALFTEFGQRPSGAELEGRSLEKDEEALAALWGGKRRVLAVIDTPESLDRLRNVVAAPVTLVAERGKLRVVSNRPAR